MIYFFDRDMELKKLVVSSNVYNPTHQQVKNGMILAQLDFDIDYAFMFIDKVEYFGYYYNETFYLHRIKTVEPDFAENIMTVAGNHIFFDDMIGYNYIRDKRPVNRDANYVLQDTIGEVTRWDIVMTDVTEPLSSSFYYLTPMEALEQIVKDYQIEYEPKILFDGKKINAYQLHVANKLGNKNAQRVRFGDKVLRLKYDIDYSDISTAIIGRGKGEEVGDGYGRRIDITSVSFSRNGVVSPTGKDYMEDPRITDLYGYNDGTPKYEIVIFEDIEDVNELAEATYNYYVEKSKPKMLFETEVTDIGIKHIGDSLLIVKPENNLAFKVRVEKIDVNLHNPEVPTMELGDYEYFQESKVDRRNRLENQRIVNEYGSVITGMKRDFDARFDAIVEQWLGEFDQTKIDLSALVEQHRLELTNLINTTRTNMENHFNSEVDRAFSEAETNYEIINNRITNEIDTARNEVISDINNATDLAISEAERISTEKAKTVQDNLDAFSNTHSKLLSDMSDRVSNIDEFLGDTTRPLQEHLYSIQQEVDDKLKNFTSWHYNYIRGTRFDEPELISLSSARGSIVREETVSFFRTNPSSNIPYVALTGEFSLIGGKEYTFSADYRTSTVNELNYVWLIATDGTYNISLSTPSNVTEGDNTSLIKDNSWRRTYFRFVLPRDATGRIRIGFGKPSQTIPEDATMDIRLPYLTESDRTQWLYHQLDNTQSLEEITRRITDLEYGTQEFITRSVYDAFTDSITGTVRSIEDTVDGYESIISNHDNWITQNGSSILQTVDEVTQKIWKNDIHNPNIIPYSDILNENNHKRFSLVGGANQMVINYTDWLRVRSWAGAAYSYMGVYTDYFEIVAGNKYTFSFESWESNNHNTDGRMGYTFVTGADINNISLWNRMTRKKIGTIVGANIYLNIATFEAVESTKIARMLIGSRIIEQGAMATFWFRHPKLEMGDVYTPYESSFTSIEQRVDEIGLSVQGIEGDIITQNDIIVNTERIVIGSQQIGGNNLASMLAISPSAMDIVTNALNITGNVNVKGDIQSIAMNAVKADFASLFATQVKANTIDVDYIKGRTAWFERLYLLNANIERLTSQFVFTDAITAKSLDAIEANIGRVRTAFLKADVIKGTHIESNTISIQHLTGYDAILTTLMARTIFSNEVRTLSLEAVEADISNLRSKIITTGIIEAKHLKSELALVDRVFSSNAMIERLTSKTAFLRDIRAITIDAVQINLQAIMNDMGKVEGGLTIRRPDGAIFVENGINKFGVPIITKGYAGSNVEFDGANYITNSRGAQIFERAFCDHSGRWANFSFSIGMMWNADSKSTNMAVVIRPANTPTGVSVSTLIEEFTVYRDSSTSSVVMNVRLPRPTYGALSFTLEFYRIGDNSNNPITIRSNRCWVSA